MACASSQDCRAQNCRARVIRATPGVAESAGDAVAVAAVDAKDVPPTRVNGGDLGSVAGGDDPTVTVAAQVAEISTPIDIPTAVSVYGHIHTPFLLHRRRCRSRLHPPPTEVISFSCSAIVDQAFIAYVEGLDGTQRPEYSCAKDPAEETWATFQRFERGFMLQLDNNTKVYIYYDIKGRWELETAPRQEGDPESLKDMSSPGDTTLCSAWSDGSSLGDSSTQGRAWICHDRAADPFSGDSSVF